MSRLREDFARGLLRHAPTYLVFALLLSLLAGGLAAGTYRRADEADLSHLLKTQAQRQAVQLTDETLRGRTMGAVAMLGINEPVLKELVQGRLPPDAPRALERLQPLRRALAAEGLYVMDADGRVVANASDFPAVTGLLWQDRPYWLQAFAGQETVYPIAEGDDVLRRSLFLAAPLYAEADRASLVIGVVAIKLPAEGLDASLRALGEHALLLSPLGLVYASSDERWNFRLAADLDHAQAAGLSQQFGPAFQDGAIPRRLSFDLARDRVTLLGERHLSARASLRWPDATGRWQLVLLASPSRQESAFGLMTIGGVVALLVFALLALLLRGVQNHDARRQALALSEAASRELMQLAQFKARQSELTLQLQRARELPALARTLFDEISRFLPMHQGSLYCVEPGPAGEPRLRLAGSYATDQAPERVALGDGLLGQCARERRSLSFSDVPPGFWTIESGLGQALPRSLLLLPVLRNDVLIGVLELASMDPDCARIEAALEGLLPVLAMNLEVLLAEQRLERLLAEARAQAGAAAVAVDASPQLDYADTTAAAPAARSPATERATLFRA